MRYTLLRKGKGNYRVIDTRRMRLWKLRSRVFAWAGVVKSLTSRAAVKMAMYRLSYDTGGTLVKPSNWQALQIKFFMKALHERMGKRLLAYAWVAELQERGVIHYHVIIVYTGRANFPDRDVRAKDARGHLRVFKRLWVHGSSHSDFRVRSPFYISSYVKKEYQKAYEFFPSGCHAWAVWVSDEAMQRDLRFHSLAEWKQNIFLQEYLGVGDGEGKDWLAAWSVMEWEVKRQRLVRAMSGERWEYAGSFSDASALARWNVTEDLLLAHITTDFQRPTETVLES
jgi:hypothetical protein